MKSVLAYVKKNERRFQREFFDWLRIPSVSADFAYHKDVLRAGEYAAEQLKKIGMDKVIFTSPSRSAHPIVIAEKIVDPSSPTVLIYGHYDVQPPDPLKLWETPPFEPTVRGGRVYARGANDNKGQIFSHIKGVEAWLKGGEKLPVNVKFLIEGEEEISSIHLPAYVAKHRRKLKADYVLISDTEMISPTVPAITYGLRGICFLEIVVEGPNRDIHSGFWGGVVANPANVLTKMLASLTDDHYRVREPNFYKGIYKVSKEEKKNFSSLPWNRKELLKELGMNHMLANSQLDFFEKNSAFPTFDINGMVSGYIGEGEKTIIPSWAKAKLSFRLVPNQNYRQVIKVMTRSLQKLLPKKQGLKLHVVSSLGGDSFITDLSSPGIQAAQRALKKVFNHTGYCVRSGASIPVVATLKDQLQADVVMMGFGLKEDRIHSPNESYSLTNFRKGIQASIYFLHEVSH